MIALWSFFFFTIEWFNLQKLAQIVPRFAIHFHPAVIEVFQAFQYVIRILM